MAKHQISRSEIVKYSTSCPLCGDKNQQLFHQDAVRTYRRCNTCLLVFVPVQYWLSHDREKAEYDLHQNSIHDKRYRNFLARLSRPLLSVLGNTQIKGLDYGCGPVPVLANILGEFELQMEVYDPFYFATNSILNTKYDFICATEVVEHFRIPDSEFKRLFSLLKPNGILAIMTKLVRDRSSFKKWHYIRDKTHLSYYSRETFQYISRLYETELTYYGDDVIFLQNG